MLTVNEIGLSLLHAAYQFGVGTIAGTALDWAMGEYLDPVVPQPDDYTSIALASAEIVAQITGSALLAAALFKSLVEQPDGADPAAGFALSLVLMASQPKLIAKISALTKALRETAGVDYVPVSSTVQKQPPESMRNGPWGLSGLQ